MTDAVYWMLYDSRTANAVHGGWEDELSMLAELHAYRISDPRNLEDLLVVGSDEQGVPVVEYEAKNAPPPVLIMSGQEFLR